MKKIPGGSLKRKHTPLLLLALGGVAGISAFIFRGRLTGVLNALKNKYLLIAGVFGSMAGVIFLIFRAIRFLIRLYP